MLVHDLQDLRAHFSKPETYVTTTLVDPCNMAGLAKLLGVPSVYGSKNIRTRRGQLHADDMLVVKDGDQVRVGLVRVFLKAELPGLNFYFCVIDWLQRLRDQVYKIVEGQPTYFPCGQVLMHVPYQKQRDNVVRPILPTVLPDRLQI